jgi:hypothetical protein
MRIKEFIIDEEIAKLKSPISIDKKSKKLKLLSGGSRSKVYHIVKNDKVIKIWRMGDPQNDAYLKWIEKVKDLSSNPFLPKVHNIKIYSSPNKINPEKTDYQGIVIMEKLEPLSKFPDSILLPLFRKTGIQLRSRIRFLSTQWTRENLELLKSEVTDPNLHQALSLVSEILAKLPHASGDLHTGNWMVRKDKETIQIVLTDPVV